MMTRKNEDAASLREDSFLAELVPQVTEHLAEQHAEDFDAKAGQARFLTWLAAHTTEPDVPAKGRPSTGYARPAGIGWIKQFLIRLSGTRDAIPVPNGRFLIWLSGAQRQILEECPTERPKYVGIGAAVLISAVVAGASLAVGLVTGLHVASWAAWPAAFAWGTAVLSLNRLFVVSLSRGGRARVQLFRTVPRLLLALLVGLIISTPLVLQIFRPEIQHQITVQHDQAAVTAYQQVLKDPVAQQIATDQAKYDAAVTALEHAQSAPAAAALRQEVSAAGQELQEAEAILQRQTTEAQAAVAKQDNADLLTRLQALDTITADNSALAVVRWVLFVLFVVIDCMPVVIKVMLNLAPKSIYDWVLEAEEKAQLRIAEHRRAAQLAVQITAAEIIVAEEREKLEALQTSTPDIREASPRIMTLHPRTYNEACTIGEHLREGTPVIINLTEMTDSDATRLVDFSAGLVMALRGSIDRVTDKVFLLTPAHVEVTAEDKARIAARGFFTPGHGDL